ncbi:MAG TPA: PIN domain-containing protein [Stellaceae bacterium]|nr:PIN domain-containing protein [Stellaceae bacterium]
MSVDSEAFTLDTNVLVYAIDTDAGVRHELAKQIIPAAAACDCLMTLQAILEFYAVCTRKGLMPRADAAAQALDWLELFPCGVASPAAARAALADAVAGRASYWDALLVATAAGFGCTLILSEDMADGAVLGGVESHNPFDPAGGLTERTRRLLEL